MVELMKILFAQVFLRWPSRITIRSYDGVFFAGADFYSAKQVQQ
jgi:hypothetical protein